jgi:ribosomal protein S18 acetylase RimI-like enzyme
MYIDKRYRGTGLSTMLLNKLLTFAKGNNYKEIYLGTTSSAQRAIGFYKKSGFERIEQLPDNINDFYKDTDFFKFTIK